MNRTEAFTIIINDLDTKGLVSWGIAWNSRIKLENKEELISSFINKNYTDIFSNGIRTNQTVKFKKLFTKIIKQKRPNSEWDTFLLEYYNLKYCGNCNNVYILDNFRFNNTKSTGKQSHCKECQYANTKNTQVHRQAKRRAYKLNATISWANELKIKEIYKQCPIGYQVDHIIPLQGEKVCGLHIEYNLQYLSAKDNQSKNNRFEINLEFLEKPMRYS